MDKNRDDELHKFKAEQANSLRLSEEELFASVEQILRSFYESLDCPIYDLLVIFRGFEPLAP